MMETRGHDNGHGDEEADSTHDHKECECFGEDDEGKLVKLAVEDDADDDGFRTVSSRKKRDKNEVGTKADLLAPADFFTILPEFLPEGQPYYFLSERQQNICKSKKELSLYSAHLPGWVPHRRVADALGHSHAGIEAALARLGRPYVWASEFENVHTFWNYRERGFTVSGRVYKDSEDFFHKQKPNPFNKELWDGASPGFGRRDEVMLTAVRKKFEDLELKALLLSTHNHPLLSIKGDAYWGMLPSGRGENMLAKLLMNLRAESDASNRCA